MPIFDKEIVINKRLKHFIKKCFKNNNALSKELGIDGSTISKYLKNKRTLNFDLLLKLSNIGLSLDWLFTGYGSMFSLNKAGKNLSNIDSMLLLTKNRFFLKLRIQEWIEMYYENIYQFSLITNYDISKIESMIIGNRLIEPSFLILLCDYGCSLDWLKTGEGNPTNGKVTGRFLTYNNDSLRIDEKTDDLWNTDNKITTMDNKMIHSNYTKVEENEK